MLRPEIPQDADNPRLVQPDSALQKHQKLRRQARPAFSQQQVVAILQPVSGGPMNHINRIQQFLQIQKANIPRILLLLEDRLQRSSGVAMSTTRIVKHNGEVTHDQPPCPVCKTFPVTRISICP